MLLLGPVFVDRVSVRQVMLGLLTSTKVANHEGQRLGIQNFQHQYW